MRQHHGVSVRLATHVASANNCKQKNSFPIATPTDSFHSQSRRTAVCCCSCHIRNEGNSCRSPMAEAVLKDMVAREALDWVVDSAAIADWNVGYPPEDRCLAILRENGLDSNHIGRQIGKDDFERFDYIFGMDEGNVSDLKALAPDQCRAQIELLGRYRMKELDKIIFDPYFERGVHGFRRCYTQIVICCQNFIQQKRSIG